jgi:5-hydroxyisourate hydrolase-like protein (transthyretin family)
MTTALLAALLLSFQILTPAPQQQQAPAAKGSIEGIVLRAASGEPLARAEVRLTKVRSEEEMREVYAAGMPDPDSANPPVLTETDGKFAFKDINAGQYWLEAERNGYPTQPYGQKVAGGRGTILNVAAGQSIRDVTFRLVQGGVVTGRVRDAAGEPVAGLGVSLMRSRYDEFGKKTLSVVNQEDTDDRGEYRFFWVEPGRYYVRATRSEGYRAQRVIEDRPLPRVFYPGTLDPESAAAIEVRPGAELSAIDIVLPSVSGYRVTGRLVDSSTGKPPKNANIQIVPKKRESFVLYENVESAQYNSNTGTFQIRNVLPGSYWLSASVQNDFNQPLSADRLAEVRTGEDLWRVAFNTSAGSQTAIDVAGADLSDLVLTLNRGVSIPARFSLEGEDFAAIKGWDSIRVGLQANNGNGQWAQSSRMNADGIARVDNVMPAEYEVSVDYGTAKDLYVKEILYGRAEALNDPVRISDQAPATFTVLLSTKVGQVEGTLTDALSQPVGGAEVVLVPDRRDQRRLFKAATTDPDGRFVFRALPPGDYKVFSWEALEPWAYHDKEMLSRYETLGRSVRIQESSKETADLKIIPAPKP